MLFDPRGVCPVALVVHLHLDFWEGRGEGEAFEGGSYVGQPEGVVLVEGCCAEDTAWFEDAFAVCCVLVLQWRSDDVEPTG